MIVLELIAGSAIGIIFFRVEKCLDNQNVLKAQIAELSASLRQLIDKL